MSENKPALRINEALDFHEKTKAKSEPTIQKIDLAKELFKGAKPKTLPVNMSNLVNGKTTRVDPAWVKHICAVTGVDANFLFGIKPMNPKTLDKYESGAYSK